MHILLTNDDGIMSEGIYGVYRELVKFARVTVVAPDGQRSSVSHAITLAHPIRSTEVHRDGQLFGTAVSGFPADSVKFALDVILKNDRPDIVVSGINQGCNDGCSVIYSGTVAGAREGALNGIPSLAVSLDSFSEKEFQYASQVTASIVKEILDWSIPAGTFLNVNVPYRSSEEISGTVWVAQGQKQIHAEFLRRIDHCQKEYYWLSGKSPAVSAELNDDTSALAQGYVTIVPIQCDATNYDFLKSVLNKESKKDTKS